MIAIDWLAVRAGLAQATPDPDGVRWIQAAPSNELTFDERTEVEEQAARRGYIISRPNRETDGVWIGYKVKPRRVDLATLIQSWRLDRRDAKNARDLGYELKAQEHELRADIRHDAIVRTMTRAGVSAVVIERDIFEVIADGPKAGAIGIRTTVDPLRIESVDPFSGL